MKRPVARLVVLFAIAISCASVAMVSGCRQSEDERCQVQDDCEPELVCCVRDNTEAAIIGGVCKPPNRCELDLTDAGVDSAIADASGDGASAEDAADAATLDAAVDSVADSAGDAVHDAPPADVDVDAADNDAAL